MANHNCDLVVIGSGPGGYVAAVRAQQLGLKTICVEKAELGGVCLNWGCIPSKALLKSAEYANFLGHSEDYGLEVSNVNINFPNVIKRSRKVASQMSNGVKYLFGKYKVQHVVGFGKLKSANTIDVHDENGKVTDTITTKNVIIATGARPRILPGIEVDRKNIWTSTEAMLSDKAPKSLVIMGSGAIGVEFGYFYNAMGTDVTILEYQDRIVPVEDKDISKELARSFKKSGIKLVTGAKVTSAKPTANGAEITYEKNGKIETISAEKALSAIGVQANLEGIGLEEVGIKVEKGAIVIDELLRTNVPNVYAIGDVAGAPWLAHKATAEGIACVEYIAGHGDKGIDYNNIPGCTYCVPQIASLGYTEEKAKELGYELKVGKFPFSANGKAHGIGKATGFVKVIFDAKYGEVLGVHMIGQDVTEMIGEIGIAKTLDGTGESIMKTIHAHPTLSEAIMEAAAEAYGETVNI
ncbi:dihydrolipoyl dehydrogenase [Candidatus Kapabacteria bacterium]|nr:dihydrolipoyl dehydrogenase [Candidatus Kapabacteria bacterium]